MPKPIFGSFQIIRELGRGGMGVVFLGHDTRLDRHVAIKALPADFAADPDRLARFQREARILASLNHPNVAAIHGLEESDGERFLVLEYVEGQTLAERLKRGPIPPDESLNIAGQIAEALEAAHEKGVIHRDLKPGNVMLTSDGIAKVLDFGLARSTEESGSTTTITRDSPTITTPAHSPTIPGVIMGTAGYMSPEQARGKAVDKRSDIFSFGCVLYEMLTGVGPFPGETATDSLGAIVHKEPDWSTLPPGVPPRLRELLSSCLAKDRRNRLRDIGDARLVLERAGHTDPLQSPVHADRRRERLAWAIAILSAGAAIAAFAASGLVHSRDASTLTPFFSQVLPELNSRFVSWGDVAGPVVVSPDGTTLAFTAQVKSEPQRLWFRRLDQPSAEPLQGTEGANFPFWSPDSHAVGFFAAGRLRTIELSTRAIRDVCETRGGRGGAWTSKGQILFAPEFQSGIMKVAAEGGTPQTVTEVEKSKHTSHRWPWALPDGDHFLFTAVSHEVSRRGENGLFLGTVDGSPPKSVLRSQFNAQYIDGRLLFLRDDTLMSVAMDPCTGSFNGEPTPLIKGIETDPTTWHAGFSAAAGGLLAYYGVEGNGGGVMRGAAGIPATGIATRIAKIARGGKPVTYFFDGIPNDHVRVSPDGGKLATCATPPDAAYADVWITETRNFENGKMPEKANQISRLTFSPGHKRAPVWSPDGSEIAYALGSSWTREQAGIYIKSVARGTERLILQHEDGKPDNWPDDWSRDGKYLIIVRGNWITVGQNDIWALPLSGGEPFVVVSTPADDGEVALSPDAHWLAYRCTESNGVSDVFVEPFVPGWEGATTKPAPKSRWRVTESGGSRPRWRSDGKEIYYMDLGGSIMAVQVIAEGDVLRFESRTALFQIKGDSLSSDFDVSPDGQFFYVQGLDIPADRAISLVQNWQRLLNQPR